MSQDKETWHAESIEIKRDTFRDFHRWKIIGNHWHLVRLDVQRYRLKNILSFES